MVGFSLNRSFWQDSAYIFCPMNKKILVGLVSALLAHSVFAFEPFEIKDIRVEGIQRTEAGTVFSYLPVKIGDIITDEKAASAIKALFATGFFKDVRLEIDGQVLVVVLEERPAIASLDFVGLKSFKAEDLRRGLRDVGLAESRIFDRAMVERAEQELKRQYLSQGRYAVDVKVTVTPLERNRVAIKFTVNEGEVAKIKQINIVGAKAFKEKDLLSLMAISTPNWMSWYTKNDQYSKQKLSGDLEALRSYYMNQGYLEFNIESTQVSISADKQDIYITINLTEGEKFTIGNIKLAGNLLLPEAELRKLVKMKPGDVFSREAMTETTKAISDRLGDDGYAFANVNAAPELDREKRQVSFTLMVDPGRRVYVRQINVVGNTRTRDEVIRREVRQMESAWYNGERIRKSRDRVDRLGYFDEVSMETPAVVGATDQIDVNLKVKEKPTGNISLGAGFSSSEKLSLSGAVQQSNVFGSGKNIGVQVSTSKSNRILSLSHTDPYFTIDGVSQGFDLYTRKTDTSQLNYVSSFVADSTGGGVRYGIPIGEDDYLFLGLSYDQTKLKLSPYSAQRYIDYVTKYGEDSNTVSTTVGWQKDGRDSLLYPTKGTFNSVSVELALPGSTVTYVRGTYKHQRFEPVSKTFTLALTGELGLANSYGGKEVPFFKNFYAGGIGSVRGFESNSLGPRDPQTGDYLGGTKRATGSAELLFGLPGAKQDRSFRFSAFVDGGGIFGDGNTSNSDAVRFSAGLSASWNSPLGPLKFSLAKPLNKKQEDKTQAFQFQLGSTF
jgi:outer membrane protein insertion porin family